MLYNDTNVPHNLTIPLLAVFLFEKSPTFKLRCTIDLESTCA